MEFAEVLAARRSCRAFRREPIPEALLATVLAAAGRGPTAGNTWALDLIVLDQPELVQGYWDVTLPAGDRRDRFPWPGLLDAPVLAVVAIEPDAYTRRYGEPDKARTGLGAGVEEWAVPYWWVDAGAAVMAMLLAATAAGLGSLLFGVFDHEPAVRALLGVPQDRRLVGTVALGYPEPGGSRRSGSATRTRPAVTEMTHRGHW